MFEKVHHVTYVVYSIREIAEYMEKTFGMKPWRADEWGLDHEFKAARGTRTLLYKIGGTILDFSEPWLDENDNAIYQGGGAALWAKQLNESGPGIFHVGWGVSNMDQINTDLLKKGYKMDGYGHDAPLHNSLHRFYRVLNILPENLSPTYAHAIRGQFFQVAQGEPGPQLLAEKGTLDWRSLPK